MSRVSFAWLIHSHQPVGNFDHVIEEAYQRSYAPFLTILALHPRVRVSLHYSGILLEWIENRHPEFFDKLRQLIARGQIELVGGGYYEPILPAIPDRDKMAQVHLLTDYLASHLGVTPRGAWVAERVWEPSLARPLAQAGIEYALLDDTHFLAAGLEPGQLHGAYMTEEAGYPLRLVPSLKSLRYAIPFRGPEETLRIFREGAATLPATGSLDDRGLLFASGDDGEKFGVWPGTYEHVYKDGWLERFLQALEAAAGWLEITTLSDYLRMHSPAGRIYLPTASYAEMMEWALPFQAQIDFRAAVKESERAPHGERRRRFLRGGLWHNFLSKYSESNQTHKLMLNVSRRWQDFSRAAPGSEAAELLRDARTHLFAAQCNDAYWHGVFGGLYAPHLRSGVLGHLIRAEALLDQVDQGGRDVGALRVAISDFDADGYDEILAEDTSYGLVLRPADGGTVSSLRFKPAGVELINSLARRPETYHDDVRQLAATPEKTKAEGPASIHDLVLSKEDNLQALLHYDRYQRHGFRTYVFPASKQWEDFRDLRLEENQSLAGGAWKQRSGSTAPGVFVLEREACLAACESPESALRTTATKIIATSSASGTWTLECRSSIPIDDAGVPPLRLGVEMVFNLLAPDAPDRYFLAGDARYPLQFSGELKGSRLLLVDRWQRVKILLSAHPEARWWVTPIQTVSQSESGFESVYQGSAIMAVWKIGGQADFATGQNAEYAVTAEVVREE
jgi:4-alpha-glucanotransferase